MRNMTRWIQRDTQKSVKSGNIDNTYQYITLPNSKDRDITYCQ